MSALEITAFLIICLVTYRRVLYLPKMIVSNPFVAFAMTSLFLGGLAYASFANLGVLTRQRSLILPLMFLIPCLPPLPLRGTGDTTRNAIRETPVDRARAELVHR